MQQNDTKVIFDISNIIDFILNNDVETNKTEITEIYTKDEDNVDVLVNKQLNEIKAKNDTNIGIKYDLIKNLMSLVTTDMDNTYGKAIAFNTLSAHGFIKEI